MTEEIKKRGKWGYFVGSGILLILLVVGGIYLFIQKENYVGTNDAFIDSYRIDLSPDILARVIELKVDEGDFVKVIYGGTDVLAKGKYAGKEFHKLEVFVSKAEVEEEMEEEDFDIPTPSEEAAPTSTPNNPPPKAAPENDVYAELMKLGDLRDKGIITDEEFAKMKKEIIDKF